MQNREDPSKEITKTNYVLYIGIYVTHRVSMQPENFKTKHFFLLSVILYIKCGNMFVISQALFRNTLVMVIWLLHDNCVLRSEQV
jgi:hypothetical protein